MLVNLLRILGHVKKLNAVYRAARALRWVVWQSKISLDVTPALAVGELLDSRERPHWPDQHRRARAQALRLPHVLRQGDGVQHPRPDAPVAVQLHAQFEPIWADLNGGMDKLPDLADLTGRIRSDLLKNCVGHGRYASRPTSTSSSRRWRRTTRLPTWRSCRSGEPVDDKDINGRYQKDILEHALNQV
uniref:Uncharacterized protein n=1 Tax=Mycena chlorophos TaxID=658473 RepID=A0ABQ0KXD4_MYCCL|nr:predicted protein [Mycena chlorophos]